MRLSLRPLRRAARGDAGFTLVELLVAMALGSIVLTALMTVFINGLTGTAKVTDRVEAGQRARLTADRISTLLQAQVCSPDGYAPISSAGPTAITFTANTGDVSADPIRYQLRWDNATNRIYEDRYVGTKDSSGDITYPTSPTLTKIIGTNMVPGNGTTIFNYYGFDPSGNGVSTTPMSTVDLTQVIAVGFAITAQPERTKQTDARGTTIQGQAITGSADPSDPTEGNKC